MAPKAAPKSAATKESKKTEQKKKEKIIEDKTFGLKNKKGAKQQKFIQQVQNQVRNAGVNKSQKQIEKEREEARKEKEKKKTDLEELNAILRPVQQNAAKGVDPKTVLCAFFKQGTCGKGAKCKFSHDLAVQRKVEKRSAYVDIRDDKETNENWDEEKLKDVIDQKHGKEKTNQTTIVCKYFLDAVENNKYGWFWQCVNGDECIYRHALPPGYVLKKDRKKADKEKSEISIEDLVERERAALGTDTTKVTLITFLAWKKKKLKEKEEADKKSTEKKRSDYKSGKGCGLSGREMFTFDPSLIDSTAADSDADDEGEGFDLAALSKDVDDDDPDAGIQYREINFDELMAEYRDDPTEEPAINGAAGLPINEELFADEDLDELEEELEDLDITY